MSNQNFFKDPALFSLLVSNLVAIFFAVLFNWSTMTILWIYWFQSVIIGFFNFFRILDLKEFSTENFRINNRPVGPTEQTKFFTAFFFAFHYGFFHFGYAMALGFFSFMLILPGVSAVSGNTIDFDFVLITAAIFFVNHLFSFLFFRNKPKKKQNIGTILFLPYARIVPMHLMLIFGALLAAGGSIFVLVFFLLMKTGADVAMHWIEHRGQLE